MQPTRAWLDALRPVNLDPNDPAVKAVKPRSPADPFDQKNERTVGSLIELHALPDPAGRPNGTLSGFRALMDVRLAAHGHISDAKAYSADARTLAGDTRGRIVLLANKAKQASLWNANSEAASFTRIWMGTTIDVDSAGEVTWVLQP